MSVSAVDGFTFELFFWCGGGAAKEAGGCQVPGSSFGRLNKCKEKKRKITMHSTEAQ